MEEIPTPYCANGHGKMAVVDDGDGFFWAECRVCGNTEQDNPCDELTKEATQ